MRRDSLAVADGNLHAEVNLRSLLPRLTEEQISMGKARASLYSPRTSDERSDPVEFK
jgi:hypothetical protein